MLACPHADNIILSAGGAEIMMLSVLAKRIIILMQPTENMMLSVQGHARALTLRACSCTKLFAGGAESIILSASGAESMMFSATSVR